jgi:leader peptidase (prepilin peptidase)/N-methyltransferase
VSPQVQCLVAGIVGIVAGNLLCRWIVVLTANAGDRPEPGPSAPQLASSARRRNPAVQLVFPEWDDTRGVPMGSWWLVVELGTGILFAAFTFAYLDLRCQQTPEVAPSEIWRIGRLFYHLVLIALLIAATGTDYRDFTISDWITVPGMLIGLLGATISGELQMMHVWVDWNDPFTELDGPYLPQWMKEHQHLHGFVWSFCGLLAGGGMTWIVRGLSKFVLGKEAMGFGDVTLMAMVGSFIGWQPVLFVFLSAPLFGLAISVSIFLFRGLGFLPYGPYLSAGTLLVLFAWHWIWMLEVPISSDRTFSLRHLMGDWQSLLWLAGISLVGPAILLGIVRLFRAVPVGPRRVDS